MPRTRTKPRQLVPLDAVLWIARNDEPGLRHPGMISEQLTVVMAADLFGMEPLALARTIVTLREAPGFFDR